MLDTQQELVGMLMEKLTRIFPRRHFKVNDHKSHIYIYSSSYDK